MRRTDPSDRLISQDVDPVELTRQLIRCQSVTPANDGCLEVCRDVLLRLGFDVDLFHAGDGAGRVTNLVGVLGGGEPVLAFAGHTDVVPPGQGGEASHPPFRGDLADARVWGRGAVDMKGAVAAFLAGVQRHLRRRPQLGGSLVVLLTGDEEIGGEHGMRAVLQRLRNRGIVPNACLIGEPSNEGHLGQGIRVGRRGSLNVEVAVDGVRGHVAWPRRARNALHAMMDFLSAVRLEDLGPAEACFPPTTLQVTAIETDSDVSNVIPGVAVARLNIRFNRLHRGVDLVDRLEAVARSCQAPVRLTWSISGEPYLSEACPLAEMVAAEVQATVGHRPEMNAGGGVSDGRFLRALCPVVEFGLVGDLAHHTDECVSVEDLEALTAIYAGVLGRFFAGGA